MAFDQLRLLGEVVRDGALAAVKDCLIDMVEPSYGSAKEYVLQAGVCQALGRHFRAQPREDRNRVFPELSIGGMTGMGEQVSAQFVDRAGDAKVDIAVGAPFERYGLTVCVGVIEIKLWVEKLINPGKGKVSDALMLQRLVETAELHGGCSAQWVMLVGGVVGRTVEAVQASARRHDGALAQLGYMPLTPLRAYDPYALPDMPPPDAGATSTEDRYYDIRCYGRLIQQRYTVGA